MMAAATAGKGALLLEKNDRLGIKLGITGNGRCNITNDCDVEQLIEKTLHNPYFLYSAFYTLPPSEVITLFNRLGVVTKVEADGRVFPASDKSSEVISVLSRYIEQQGAKVCLNSDVVGITKDDGVFCVELAGGEILRANKVILATGGLSYPATGSTGSGLKFAKALGHTVVDTRPTLAPLVCAEPWVSDLMGLSLSDVEMTASDFCGTGDIIFTHFGISGPLAITASGYIKGGKITINIAPWINDQSVLLEFNKAPNRDIRNVLGGLLPKAIVPVILQLAGISADKKVNGITKEERGRLITQISGLALTVTGNRGYKEAVITSGGVCVDEIDPSTMESKIVQGLYFAGEMMDVHAVTGGYNLQIAFSTGYLAGLP
ncbi:MAG: NAD(P)/FAD-dependent oxidoreductase [Defluviitaleaceae bacterium]|nr:NAD(P)/FAD-dependent oxidoreductase [Defluviitaleaceae bacterium]